MRWGSACAISALGCLCALVASDAPMAAEWSGDASASLRQEYNDNILMTAGPHNPVLGNTASSWFTMKMLDDLFQMKATALLEYTAYIGESGLNTTNYDLVLSPVYTTGRATWKLDGEMKQDVTLGSELKETGVVLTRDQRRLLSASPSWSWSFTERTSVQLQYQFMDVRYPGSNPGLVDYEAQLVTMTGSLSATEKDTMTASLQYIDYRASSIGLQSQDYGAQIGIKHAFSETVSGELSGGADHNVTNFGAGALFTTNREWGWLLNGSLQQQSEVMLLTGGVSQQILPSGGGYLVQTQHLSGLVRRELFQPLTAFVSADAYWTSALGIKSVPDSQYYTVSTGLSWRLKEHWTLDATYRYGRSDYQHAPQAIESNAVYWRIAYNSPDKIFSP